MHLKKQDILRQIVIRNAAKSKGLSDAGSEVVEMICRLSKIKSRPQEGAIFSF